MLRDTCDVLLEITKLAMCFRIQQGKVVKSLELPIKFFFTIFTLAFTINQLYYYPLFCLYHGLNVIKVHKLQTPVMIGILTCGLIFLLLDLLWFLVCPNFALESFRFSSRIHAPTNSIVIFQKKVNFAPLVSNVILDWTTRGFARIRRGR